MSEIRVGYYQRTRSLNMTHRLVGLFQPLHCLKFIQILARTWLHTASRWIRAQTSVRTWIGWGGRLLTIGVPIHMQIFYCNTPACLFVLRAELQTFWIREHALQLSCKLLYELLSCFKHGPIVYLFLGSFFSVHSKSIFRTNLVIALRSSVDPAWQCRIYIPCSLSLLLEFLRVSMGTYGLT